MVNLESFKNLYEVRKTVRFELKPYKKTREILKWDNNYQSLDSYIKHIKDWEFEDGFDWNDFCLWKYEDFLKESKKYYWFLLQINAEIQKWRNETTKKNIYFDFKKSKGIFKNIPSLKKIQWFEWLKSKLLEIQDEYQNYFNFFDQLQDKQHKNEKKSDISIHLRKIAYLNRNLFTIFNFFDIYKTHKEILDEYKEIIDYDFEKLNNSIIASHENEISGACFWKFTFNKFALFRREASPLKENFEANKQVLQKAVATMVENGEIVNDNWTIAGINTNQIHSLTLQKKNCYSLKFEEEIWTLQGRLEKFNFNRNLDEVISELDDINGQLLNQYIQNFVNGYKNDENVLEVSFYTDHEGNKIFDKSKKYDSYENGQKKEKFYPSLVKLDLEQFVEAQKRNQIKIQPGQTLKWYQYLNLLWKADLTDEEKEQKKIVNKFLQILFKQKFINPDYNTIKEFRDTLAKHRWKLRQNVRTSEREFIQEAMVRYYGQILEKNGCYFVALFDKDKLQNDIKNIVTDSQIKDKWMEGNYFKIYKYSQLSFSALEKLCLSKDWDLLSNSSLQKAWDKYKNQKKDIEWRCDFHKNWQDKSCTSCKSNEMQMRRSFLKAFKMHILQALEKLKNDEKYKWEDWSYLYWELKQKNSVEDIVSFINQKFYKLEEKYIEQEEVFKLADTWEILLFQVYSKDFNIFNSDFVSDEENLRDYEKDTWESQKTIGTSKREDGKQENLFTTYFKNIFKDDWETFLGQEWGIFFRKADSESDKKRFRSDKFFISLDILFNKGKQNNNAKLCESKEEKSKKHVKNTTLNIFNSIKNKDEITIMWIDRGSLSDELSVKNTKISMLWYVIITLRKEDKQYVLKEIKKSWDINWFIRGKGGGWKIVGKGQNMSSETNAKDYIDFKKILSNLKEEIQKELEKNNVKRNILKIIDKKEWITSLLISAISQLIQEYNVDYIALENLDNIYEDDKSFKKIMEERTLSTYLYQNLEVQLFKKLNYIYLKNEKVQDRQIFPICSIDEVKNLDSKNFFKIKESSNYDDYKMIWNIVFVKTSGTSSTCFNCENTIKKHGVVCKNCKISVKHDGSKLDLKDYKAKFVSKNILEKQNIQQDFNNDARAWLYIAKKAKEYLEYLFSH